jgi:hypothetical protein
MIQYSCHHSFGCDAPIDSLTWLGTQEITAAICCCVLFFEMIHTQITNLCLILPFACFLSHRTSNKRKTSTQKSSSPETPLRRNSSKKHKDNSHALFDTSSDDEPVPKRRTSPRVKPSTRKTDKKNSSFATRTRLDFQMESAMQSSRVSVRKLPSKTSKVVDIDNEEDDSSDQDTSVDDTVADSTFRPPLNSPASAQSPPIYTHVKKKKGRNKNPKRIKKPVKVQVETHPSADSLMGWNVTPMNDIVTHPDVDDTGIYSGDALTRFCNNFNRIALGLNE